MGFSITSAVFGGVVIFFYSILIASTSCQGYCHSYCYGYRYRGYGNVTQVPQIYSRNPMYSYDTKMGFAAVTLTLGIIEFVTGVWVSICLCMMKPCCRDLNLEVI